MENIAKATIEVFQKSAEMNSSNPSGNGTAAQGGSTSNNNSTTSKMKPILRCLSFIFLFILSMCNCVQESQQHSYQRVTTVRDVGIGTLSANPHMSCDKHMKQKHVNI